MSVIFDYIHDLLSFISNKTDTSFHQLANSEETSIKFWTINYIHTIVLFTIFIVSIYTIWLTTHFKGLHVNFILLLRFYLVLHTIVPIVRAPVIIFSIYPQLFHGGLFVYSMLHYARNWALLLSRSFVALFCCERLYASLNVKKYEAVTSRREITKMFIATIFGTLLLSPFAKGVLIPIFSATVIFLVAGIVIIFVLQKTNRLNRVGPGTLPLGTVFQNMENRRTLGFIIPLYGCFIAHYDIATLNYHINAPNMLQFHFVALFQSSCFSLLTTTLPVLTIKKYRNYTFGWFIPKKKKTVTVANIGGEYDMNTLSEQWNRRYAELEAARKNSK